MTPALKTIGQYKTIKKLIKEAEHWNKPERERKWFHF
jgi:hypothetical protein